LNYITWNVERELVHIYGPFGIRWYSLFFLAGILLGNYIMQRIAKAEGKPVQRLDDLLFYIIIGTIVGARLGHCLFYSPTFYLQNPLEILKVWKGGLASHGGFLGVILAVIYFSYKQKDMSLWWTADRIGIVAIIAGGFIRMGNLFNSEIIGRVTNVPWAFIFIKEDNLPRHPTQIYESFGYISIGILLYVLYKYWNRKPLPGRIFGLALSLGFGFRFLIEPLKENQEAFEDGLLINMGQILSIPFILIGLYLVIGFYQKKKKLT